MEKSTVLEGIKKLRASAAERKKRNFSQTIDFVMNLNGVDMKALKINDTVELPAGRGKPTKVFVVAEGEALMQAKRGGADMAIDRQGIGEWAGRKKEIRKLTSEYDWFIIQAQMMQNFASVFGSVLGPRGKMPVPKDILGPTANPIPLIERLRKSVRIKVKDQPVVHAPAGVESMSDDEIAENVLAIYNAVFHKLENGANNVGAVYVKATMGAPVRIA